MIEASHKVAFVKDGIGFVAKVGLRKSPESEAEMVTAPAPHRGDVMYAVPDEWIAAAIDGVLKCHKWMKTYALEPQRVQVQEILGTEADTRNDIVQCAAIFACWKLHDLDIVSLQIVGDAKVGFSVEFPVNATGAQ